MKIRQRQKAKATWMEFPIWKRWGDLTKFQAALEESLARERQRVAAITDAEAEPEPVRLTNPSSRRSFQCSLSDYQKSLRNSHLQYSMLLAAYVALIEEHARNLIEYALSAKSVDSSPLGTIDPEASAADFADNYIKSFNVEVWGTRFLSLSDFTWTDVPGGQAGVVEAIALRNLTSHGLSTINSRAFNRMNDAGCDMSRWPLGSKVSLNHAIFYDCLQNLRGFGRTLASCAAKLK